VEALRAQPAGADKARRHEKELAAAERRLQEDSTRIGGLQIRSTLLTAIIAFAVFWALGSVYQGAVVARLPFQPMWWFTSMAQRGLAGGELLQDHCGYLFIYVLAQMALRPALSKVMGTEGPKFSGMDAFGSAASTSRAMGL
jgi:uncharacterized membrane protein (DUF106 family)